MQALVNIAFPVFAIIGCGFLARRLGLLGEASTDALNGFVYYFALPAVFLHSMATAPLARIFDPDFVGAYLGGGLVVYAVAMTVSRYAYRETLAEGALASLSAVFANTGYIGIPLFIAAFGPEGAFPVILATVAQTLTIFVLSILLVEVGARDPKGGNPVVDLAKSLATNPFILSAAAGLALNLSGVGLPKPADVFLSLLGSSAGPCALFALGLFLVGQSVTRGLGEALWLSFLKLVAHPAATWLFAVHVFALPDRETRDLVLMSALPAGALIFVIAQRHGVFVQRSLATILITTLLSLVTLSAIMVFYGI
jgi:hypothetical protein